MNILRISVVSDYAADASVNAGLIDTTYFVLLMKSLYAEVHTVEQPEDPVHTSQQPLFVHAYWHFTKTDQATSPMEKEQAPFLHCRERDLRSENAEADDELGNQSLLASV